MHVLQVHLRALRVVHQNFSANLVELLALGNEVSLHISFIRNI